MRIKEIIIESEDYPEFDNPIEDEADTRGDSALIEVLELLRNEAADAGAVTPRVKVDTVINRVRSVPGNEAFNYAALEKAKQDNEVVKNMIKSIDDDTHTATKYVYLTSPENTIDEPDVAMASGGIEAEKGNKIVSSMAKRAAGA